MELDKVNSINFTNDDCLEFTNNQDNLNCNKHRRIGCG